jgi:hypothetical protein
MPLVTRVLSDVAVKLWRLTAATTSWGRCWIWKITDLYYYVWYSAITPVYFPNEKIDRCVRAKLLLPYCGCRATLLGAGSAPTSAWIPQSSRQPLISRQDECLWSCITCLWLPTAVLSTRVYASTLLCQWETKLVDSTSTLNKILNKDEANTSDSTELGIAGKNERPLNRLPRKTLRYTREKCNYRKTIALSELCEKNYNDRDSSARRKLCFPNQLRSHRMIYFLSFKNSPETVELYSSMFSVCPVVFG